MNKGILHLIETIKYRFEYSISDIDENYPNLAIGNGVRSPLEILHHMRGLIYYTKKIICGDITTMSAISDWNNEVSLFLESLENLKKYISKESINEEQYLRIVQGPLSDALTHIGQLAMLSRLNGRPLEKQNFSRAKIGSDQ